MDNKSETPLRCDPVLRTIDGWMHDLTHDGHICFSLDGNRYFIFPNGPHEYGFCTWKEAFEGEGYPTHVFHSEDEVLGAKLFDGRSIRERLDEILVYDQA